MKKIFPYAIIIYICYLVVAFVKSDMNTFNWKSEERLCLVFVLVLSCLIYGMREEKDEK
jgi:hypothetical protein